jgi:hypothetical protein
MYHYLVAYTFEYFASACGIGRAEYISETPIRTIQDVEAIETQFRKEIKEIREIDEDSLKVFNFQLLRQEPTQ